MKRSDPSADDLKEVLGSVGAEAEDDRIRLLLAEANGKDVSEQTDDDGESQDASTW
jgi:ribosomal protein L12E/L44/L45/RPP1/RPP2